jgi:hypothetical protein
MVHSIAAMDYITAGLRFVWIVVLIVIYRMASVRYKAITKRYPKTKNKTEDSGPM